MLDWLVLKINKNVVIYLVAKIYYDFFILMKISFYHIVKVTQL